MAYKRAWKPSRAAAKAFKEKMDEITTFCNEHGISQSRTSDSYYFTIDGINYRVSNHTIEASNRAAYDDIYGKKRELYHAGGREEGTVYIHASKTRLIDIYNDLRDGYTLDGRGNRKK